MNCIQHFQKIIEELGETFHVAVRKITGILQRKCVEDD